MEIIYIYIYTLPRQLIFRYIVVVEIFLSFSLIKTFLSALSTSLSAYHKLRTADVQQSPTLLGAPSLLGWQHTDVILPRDVFTV